MPLTITAEQRRARLGIRHHLAVPVSGLPPAEIARDVVALHATDPASVYLSVAARAVDLSAADIGRALYDDRTMIRMLGMRRTMFVVPTASASVVQHSSSDVVGARLRRALVKELGSVVADPEPWLAEVEDSVLTRLHEQGGATGAALSKADPRLRTKIVYAEGKAYGGPVAINSRVLNILSAGGRIVRGRPGGGWTGSMYEWTSVEKWLPDGLPRLSTEGARIALVRLWLARFGPGTIDDIVWWTGWNRRDTQQALAVIGPTVVDLDGEAGLVLCSDTGAVDESAPWIALLPSLDPTPMGWSGRDWYLEPAYRTALFDRTGNIGPSVWCNGRIVGGWGQRPDATIGWRLFEDIGTAMREAVESEAARLTAWIDKVRVLPKFRTPLERELSQVTQQ